LTVKFLGDTEKDLLPELKSAVGDIAGRHKVIQTALDQLGAFPNLRRPRVFWVGSSAPTDEIAEIASEIDGLTHQLGWDLEKRAFKPHLTLGRVRQGKRVDRLAEYVGGLKLSPIELTLDHLALFKSTLTPQGAIYDRLFEAELGREEFAG
jgi:2'-5' RNA ligase